MIILLYKRLPYTRHSVDRDQEGRKLTIYLTIASKDLAITNIYTVNSPGTVFFQYLSSWVLRSSEPLHLQGRDFNSVMNGYEDKSSPRTALRIPLPSTLQTTTLLATTMSSLHMLDIWRLSHLTDREFTF